MREREREKQGEGDLHPFQPRRADAGWPVLKTQGAGGLRGRKWGSRLCPSNMLCSLRAFSRKIYGSMREAQRRIALIQADLDDQARLGEVLAGKEWKVIPQVA